MVERDETWLFLNACVNVGQSLTNEVTATAENAAGTKTTDTDETTVSVSFDGGNVDPEIQVEKTASPTSIQSGGNDVTYTYKITNTGAAASVDPLTLTFLVDSGGSEAPDGRRQSA